MVDLTSRENGGSPKHFHGAFRQNTYPVSTQPQNDQLLTANRTNSFIRVHSIDCILE